MQKTPFLTMFFAKTPTENYLTLNTYSVLE